MRNDLSTFSYSPTAASPASIGQLQASLNAFSRTIDDYSHSASNELVQAKKLKAQDRLKSFRADLAAFRDEFEILKGQRDDARTGQDRSELLGRRPHTTGTPEIVSGDEHSTPAPPAPYLSSNPLFAGRPPPQTYNAHYTQHDHAFRESSFLDTASSQLDGFLDRGRAVLGDLNQQRDVLKGTQRKLYSVGNTLGISGDTIRMVERRAKEDKWIFWSCVVVFVLFVWLVLHYLT